MDNNNKFNTKLIEGLLTIFIYSFPNLIRQVEWQGILTTPCRVSAASIALLVTFFMFGVENHSL
jgi:hypothetical protein